MEFMKLVSAKQASKKISDTDVAKYTGISEYNYYNLKNYRTYLTRVAYFTLCTVFKLPVGDDLEINRLLLENKEKVGTEETNLYVSADYVNPEYVAKMEQELSSLKEDALRLKNKDIIINKQYRDLEVLKHEIDELKSGLDKRVSEAYANGVKEGSQKINNMKQANYNLFVDELNREYSEQLSKLELALKSLENSYYSLYKGVEMGAITKAEDLKGLNKPIKLYKEQLGIEISEDILKDILSLYYDKKEDISDISIIHNLNIGIIQKIIVQYKLRKEKGVVYIEKQ